MALVAVLASSVPALAQPAPSVDGTQQSSVVTLDPFQVKAESDRGYQTTNSNTASRIAIKVQDLPFSVSVLNDSLIKDLNAVTLQDALRFVSGVSKTNYDEGSFSIRGFNAASFVDGFATYGQNTSDLSLMDRVEVLKGPASMLYGLAPPGGIINSSLKAAHNKTSGEVLVRFGDRQYQYGMLDYNTTLGGTSKSGGYFAFRTVYSQESRYDWGPYDHPERNVFGEMLRWQISDRTYVETKFTYLHFREIAPPNSWFLTYDRTMLYPGLGPGETNVNGPNNFKKGDTFTYLANITHRLTDSTTFRVVGGITDVSVDFLRNAILDLTSQPLPGVPVMIARNNVFTRTGFNDKMFQAEITQKYHLSAIKGQLLAGYEHDQNNSSIVPNVNLSLRQQLIPLFNRTTADYTTGVYPRDYIARATTYTFGRTNAGYLVDQTAFGNTGLEFIGGLRYLKTAIASYLTPEAGLTYKLPNGMKFYGVYAESVLPNVHYPNDPQQGRNLEAGLKFSMMDSRVSGSIALFNTSLADIENTQAHGDGTFSYILSGKQETKGFEAEITTRVTDNWDVILNYAHYNAKIVANVQYPELIGVPSQDVSKENINLWTKYRLVEGPLKGWGAYGGINYRTDFRPYVVPPYQVFIVPGYTRLDVGISKAFKLQNFDAQFDISVLNATNKVYVQALTFGPERQLRVKLDLKF